MSPFHHLLGNNLVANITNFTVWFALTFYVYLETKSVFATGMIAVDDSPSSSSTTVTSSITFPPGQPEPPIEGSGRASSGAFHYGKHGSPGV